MQNKGKISQVIGPVVDIRFNEGELPNLNNAIRIDVNGKPLVDLPIDSPSKKTFHEILSNLNI